MDLAELIAYFYKHTYIYTELESTLVTTTKKTTCISTSTNKVSFVGDKANAIFNNQLQNSHIAGTIVLDQSKINTSLLLHVKQTLPT